MEIGASPFRPLQRYTAVARERGKTPIRSSKWRADWALDSLPPTLPLLFLAGGARTGRPSAPLLLLGRSFLFQRERAHASLAVCTLEDVEHAPARIWSRECERHQRSALAGRTFCDRRGLGGIIGHLAQVYGARINNLLKKQTDQPAVGSQNGERIGPLFMSVLMRSKTVALGSDPASDPYLNPAPAIDEAAPI